MNKSTRRSPKKQTRPSSTVKHNQSQQKVEAEAEYAIQEQHSQAQITIANGEIEIERLKTTVMALNGKCTIVDDVKLDLTTETAKYLESEGARE